MIKPRASLKNWGSIFSTAVLPTDVLDMSGCEGSLLPEGAIAAAQDYFSEPHRVTRHFEAQDIGVRRMIAERHDVDPRSVLLTSASLDGLRYVAQAFFREGTIVGVLSPDFPPYPALVQNDGASLKVLPALPFPFYSDSDEIIRFAAQEGLHLLLLSNPCVCTGVERSVDELRMIADGIEGYLVVDEADAMSWRSASCLVNSCKNVLVIRSFSKWFGLADLRIGYMIVPAGLQAAFDDRLNVCGVSGPSIAAARVAINDETYLQRVVNDVHRGRALLNAALKDTEYKIVPTPTTLVAFVAGGSAHADFLGSGIYMNPGSNYCLEMFVGKQSPPELIHGGRINTSNPELVSEAIHRLRRITTH